MPLAKWLVLCKLKQFKKTTFQIMALKIIDHGTPEYAQMIKLRDDILRKPLGLSFSPEELEKEKDNILIAAFDDDQMLGCCMLVEEEPEVIRLRQMAVLNDLQGKGIGRALMNFNSIGKRIKLLHPQCLLIKEMDCKRIGKKQ